MSCVLGVSWETETIGCMYVYKDTYDKELTYMIMQAEKSQDL